MEELRVRDVVRAVVAEVAEEELPVVDGLAHFDDDTVVRKLRGRGRRNEPGLAWDEIATMVTPVVWLAIDHAARQLGANSGKGTGQALATLLRTILRRRRRDIVVPPLTPAQRAEVRAQVLATAATRGVGKKHAEELADAVYVKLSMVTTPR